MGKDGNATASVAAHRGRVAVGIVVAHLKSVVPHPVVEGHQTVGTHAEPPMTDMGNGLGRKLRVLLTGIDKDKVVAGPVEFIKR